MILLMVNFAFYLNQFKGEDMSLTMRSEEKEEKKNKKQGN